METKQPGTLKRFWAFVKKPSAKYSILAIFSVAFISGILFWGAFNTFKWKGYLYSVRSFVLKNGKQ